MTIIANGKSRAVPDGSTIGDFLVSLGWKPSWVVVEHNGVPLPRAQISGVQLAEGDRIEVVRAVAGG